ncbi:MAG TPA: hypothetical protein VLA46_04310 [Saprospiraceae bacterium]|nr:hypothetical protein [Saprospiraceae bacterium]
MKNVYILLALSFFPFLRTSLDGGVARQPAFPSNAIIRQSADLLEEFVGCDLSCMPIEIVGPVADDATSVLSLFQMMCTRIGCVSVPEAIDITPSIPALQESMPAIFKDEAPSFESPGMLNGMINES